MSFDGITMAAMVHELNQALAGGRINKIAQPEADELLITARGNNGNCRLLLSASASLPLVYFTEKNKPSPLTAPNFCMLLRKYVGSARILSVTQPGLERAIVFHLEHLNEMGDISHKKLVMELMGKHSNLIFCDEDDTILDSIKHVSSHMSSVREVLPGRHYFLPHTQDKLSPLDLTWEAFNEKISEKPSAIAKALYNTITGLSPCMAQEICFRASIDGDDAVETLSETARQHLFHTLMRLMEDVRSAAFTPNIVYRQGEPAEYGVFPYQQYGPEYNSVSFDSVSAMLEAYYAEKNAVTRIRQKSSDLRRIVQTALERSRKKQMLQEKQLQDTAKKDKYKLYGELLNTFGYDAPEGASHLEVTNYYTGENVDIPLDNTLTAMENAKRYFDRYSKLKRTEEATTVQLADTVSETEHLESIANALDIAVSEMDLADIKEELTQYGYIRRHEGGKKVMKTGARSKPLHYISSDGYDIYVGKNNFQNDELTFKIATGNDWWFHAKKIAGSHVVVRSKDGTLPDRTFEEAGSLAAYYSKARSAPKVEVDYIQKKHVKKPAGAKPGFVVYYTNYSLMAVPNIDGLQEEK